MEWLVCGVFTNTICKKAGKGSRDINGSVCIFKINEAVIESIDEFCNTVIGSVSPTLLLEK
jgi:hypothetical protein